MSRDQPDWLRKKRIERDQLKRIQQAFPSEQARLMALYGSGDSANQKRVEDEGRNKACPRQPKHVPKSKYKGS